MKNRKWFKAIVGVAMALTMTFGATTQTVPFFNDNSTVITAEAASISWHWQSYDIYLTHNEAQLAGLFYSVAEFTGRIEQNIRQRAADKAERAAERERQAALERARAEQAAREEAEYYNRGGFSR